MFRKLILSGVLSIAAVAGLTALPASADAHERNARHGHRHHTRFEVRVFHRGCWDVRSSYRTHQEAYREMLRLRQCGMTVELRPCD
jgi:hypothetical protein